MVLGYKLNFAVAVREQRPVKSDIQTFDTSLDWKKVLFIILSSVLN